MATTVDVGFVEMRLAKVVAVAVPPDEPPSYCMVLEGVSQDRQLPIEIGSAEALTLSATLTGVGFGRPMSPQFAAGLLRTLGGRVRQVRIDRLITVSGGTAFGSTVEVEGPSGVEAVDGYVGYRVGWGEREPPRYTSPDALHEALPWLAAHGRAGVGGQEF